MDGLSDGELIALHKQGDPDAFGKIYERYKKTINRVARSYFLLGGDLDDVAQEGLLGLLKAANTFDEGQGASFKTYANICVASKIKTAVRLTNLKLKNCADDMENGDILLPDPEDLIINEEGRREFNEKMEKALSKFEYSVMKAYIDGLNYKEIADGAKKSEKAIDNALQRAKKKMRRSLKI